MGELLGPEVLERGLETILVRIGWYGARASLRSLDHREGRESARLILDRVREVAALELERRLAWRHGFAAYARLVGESSVAHKDLGSLEPHEARVIEEAVRRLAREMAREMASALSQRYRPFIRGRIYLFGTARHAGKTGGIPIRLVRRRRRRELAPLAVLCDVSGSVRRYSRFMLHFVHGLARRHPAVRTFLFVDLLHEVTSFMKVPDPDEAISSALSSVFGDHGNQQLGFRECLLSATLNASYG